MPLRTQILRGKETYKPPGGWDRFALGAMYTAALKEAAPHIEVNDDLTFGDLMDGQWVDFSNLPLYYMEGCPLLEDGEQILERRHLFKSGDDREILLLPGDILRAWREFKH